ncbi:hypothetical protein ACEQ8H_008703 [Pleosporales sp. CAS-2024a]
MPHYMVYHSCELKQEQYQAFAAALTDLHCELFSAPSAFVNITFYSTYSGSAFPSTTFVGGKAHPTNFIHAHLRPRGTANAPKLRVLVETIHQLWDAHVNASKVTTQGRLDDPNALHNVFVFEDLAAGSEQGFILPQAGEDRAWLNENIKALEARAEQGDASMEKLIQEMKTRF